MLLTELLYTFYTVAYLSFSIKVYLHVCLCCISCIPPLCHGALMTLVHVL